MKRVALLMFLAVVVGWFVVSSAYAVAVEVVSIKKITEGGNFDAPQWSPDGQKIYALGPNGSIVAMKADGTGLQTLHEGDGFFRKFAVSPDGNKVLFEYHENNENHSNLWLMNSDGSNKMKIADDAGDPTWSPDGSRMAFGQSGILIANNEGKNTKRLTAGGALPKFYGNSKIVYRGGIDEKWAIKVVDLNGSLIDSYLIEGAKNIKTNFYTKEIFYSYEYLKFINTETREIKEISLPEAPEDTLPLIDIFEFSEKGTSVFAIIFVEDQNTAEVISSDIWLLNKQSAEKQNISESLDVEAVGLSLNANEDKIVFVNGNDNSIYVLDIKLP